MENYANSSKLRKSSTVFQTFKFYNCAIILIDTHFPVQNSEEKSKLNCIAKLTILQIYLTTRTANNSRNNDNL